MQAGETVGTEQFTGTTPGDAARWLLAVILVAGAVSGMAGLASTWSPPAGDPVPSAPPAILLEIEPLPEPIAEPVPETVEPQPPEAEPIVEPEPETPAEPIEQAVAEPPPEPPRAGEPPTPPVADELPLEPEQEPEPVPVPELVPEPAAEPVPEVPPVPEPKVPTAVFPMPVTMSAEMQQDRKDTPPTNPQPPRQPRSEPPAQPKPYPQSAAEAAPRQQPAPSVASGPSPEEWQQRVLRHIDRRKVYPRDAQRAGQEGVAAIAFTIDANGRMLSVSIARSSGVPALDQAAIETARRASPVPKPPVSLGSTISLTASIRFTLR